MTAFRFSGKLQTGGRFQLGEFRCKLICKNCLDFLDMCALVMREKIILVLAYFKCK